MSCLNEANKLAIIKDYIKINQELRNARSKSQYFALLNDLTSIKNLCDDCRFDVISAVKKEYTRKSYMVSKNYEYYYRLSDELASNRTLFTNLAINVLPLLNDDISYQALNYQEYLNQDLINHETYNFLNIINPELAAMYIRIKNNGHLIAAGDEYFNHLFGGFTYTLLQLSEPYIFVNDNDNLQTVLNIIHEIGHYYDIEKTKKCMNKKDKPYLLDETHAIYLQLIAGEYFSHNQYYEFACLRDRYNTKSVLINSLINILNHYEQDEATPYDQILDALQYGLGICLATYYYEMYQSDPEKTNKNINNFIMGTGPLGFAETITQFGIDKELFVSGEYIKHLDLTQKK